MTDQQSPFAIPALSVTPRAKKSNYPEPFFSRMAGREKHPLGDVFGLKNFGVNLTRLLPGGESSVLHRHSKQDEFIYIVAGEVLLETDEGEMVMTAGMCAGFPAKGRAHHFLNRSNADVLYLEVGDRLPGDSVNYPTDDLAAAMVDGRWAFTHKDGTVY